MHFLWSPGTTSDDRFAYDISKLIGTPIVITEKLDGENNSMTSNGVYARSHVDFTVSPWSAKVRELHSDLKSSILNAIYYIFVNESLNTCCFVAPWNRSVGNIRAKSHSSGAM